MEGINTWDWAEHGGSYFSNKAPGSPILGVPAYALLFHIERALGLYPPAFSIAVFNDYVINLSVSVLWTALGCIFLFRLNRQQRGEDTTQALLVCFIYAFGTLVFPFDSQLWGHTTAAAFLIIGHRYLLVGASKATALGAFFLGMALFTDYLTVPSLGLAGLYIILQPSRRREWLAFAAGGAAPILALLAFQRVNFGGWFVTAAALSNPKLDGSRFGLISPSVLMRLMISPSRGLFFFCPVLIFGIPEIARCLSRSSDAFRRLCAANALIYLALVASYQGWHGGRTTGPRYLIVALPFWCLLLPRLKQLRVGQRLLFGLLSLVSALHMLAIAAVDPMVSQSLQDPLYEHVLPRLFRGALKDNARPFYTFFNLTPEQAHAGVFNLGERLFRLTGAASLLPLLVVVVPGIVILVHAARRAMISRNVT